jgi:hypothetical protein
MKQFSTTSYHFSPLQSKYYPQHSHSVSLLMSETKFYNHTNPRAKLFVYIFKLFHFWTADKRTKGFGPNGNKHHQNSNLISFWIKIRFIAVIPK